MSYTTHIPSQIRRTNNRHNTVRVTFLPFPSFVFVLPSFLFFYFSPSHPHPHPHSLLLFSSSRNSFLVNTHIHHTSFHLFLHVMICNIILSIVLCVMSYPGPLPHQPIVPPSQCSAVPVVTVSYNLITSASLYHNTPRYTVKTFNVWKCGSSERGTI